MKKILYLMLISLCMGMMTACSKDDGGDAPANPTTPGEQQKELEYGDKSGFYVSERTYNSIKITASVTSMTRIYLESFGVSNPTEANYGEYGLNQSTLKSAMQQLFYVEFSDKSDFSESTQSNGKIVGDNIEYIFNELTPNTTYYYRIYQMSKSGNFVYTDAITVPTKDIASTNIKVSYGSATISFNGSFEVYLDGYRYAEGKRDGNSIKWTESFKNQVTIKGLDPGKTYKYCISVNGAKGKEVSFTTKSLDLSGTSVQAKETIIYDSEVHGTWDFTITSNLASQLPNNIIRFGAANALLYEYVEKYEEPFVEYLADDEAYSSDTKSPYHVAHPWIIGFHTSEAESFEAFFNGVGIKIKNGTVTEDEKLLYDYFAGEIINQALIWPVRAYVEIDGERVFIGNSFDEKY